MKKNLPICDLTFREMREGNYYYVDKTEHIYQLFSDMEYRHYLLTRPRRFGKTLFLSTMKELFAGHRDLFEGLYIYDKWDWDTTYPVIHIDFASSRLSNGNPEELSIILDTTFQDNAELYDITLEYEKYKQHPIEYFKRFLKELAKKSGRGVVLLVDEYDKPLLDSVVTPSETKAFEEGTMSKENYWDKGARHNRIKETLRGLYTAIKGNKEYIRFAFLTGITRYAEGISYSGFNSVKDITMDKYYSTICGYTEKELEENFPEELIGVDRDEVRRWYDGYTWGGPHVYNPIDILKFLSTKRFETYWEDTGSVSRYLFEITKERFLEDPYKKINTLKKSRLIGFDPVRPDFASLLFQTGYLTIANPDDIKEGRREIALRFPNYEVEYTYKENLISHLLTEEAPAEAVSTTSQHLRDACSAQDIDAIEKHIRAAISFIPSIWYKKDLLHKYEGFFATTILLLFYGIGDRYLNPERWVQDGRIDLLVSVGSLYYIFEFKMVDMDDPDYSPGKALAQIRDRGYAKPFELPGNTIYLIGVEIDGSERHPQQLHFDCEKLPLT